MPRYELNDGESSKFWEIEVDGNRCEVCHGHTGGDGQRSTKEFDNAAAAQAAAGELIASRLAEGYRQDTAVEVFNPELEALLQGNPDDVDTWQVYADYLQTQDNPLGELIALGVAIEQNPDEASELHKRFCELVAANGTAWFGSAAPYLDEVFVHEWDEEAVIQTYWKYGVLRELRVQTHYEFDGPAVHELLAGMLYSPLGRFVHTVVIGITDGVEDGQAWFQDCIDTIAALGEQPNLKHLVIGDFESEECEISWSSIGDCGKLYPLLPNLEFLRIHGGGIVLGDLVHERLKILSIETGGLSAQAVRSIADARLPALETLRVWFGAEHYGADGEVSMLEPLFSGKGYPALRDLGLMNCEYQNEIAEALAGSPLLQQLQCVDLSMGTMTDEGAKVLLEQYDRFKHLEHIDVSDNYISPAMADALHQRFGEVIQSGGQDTYWDEDDLYVSVGE